MPAGVVAGCNPPDNTRYCPDQPVTRGEMAVFLERLDSKNVFLRPGEVELDGGDADTLDGKNSTEFAGRLFAVVAANGTLNRGRGVTETNRPDPGHYEVDFDQDLTDCTYTATVGHPSNGSADPGSITVALRLWDSQRSSSGRRT